jgi:hypothetical protein
MCMFAHDECPKCGGRLIKDEVESNTWLDPTDGRQNSEDWTQCTRCGYREHSVNGILANDSLPSSYENDDT